MLRISPPVYPQGQISFSAQPPEIAPPKTGIAPKIAIIGYVPPLWAWAALALVAMAYSGAVGYFLVKKQGRGVRMKLFRKIKGIKTLDILCLSWSRFFGYFVSGERICDTRLNCS